MHSILWDTLHAKIRIGNKILRLLYENVPKANEKKLTKLIQQASNQFKCVFKQGRNKATLTNLRGMQHANILCSPYHQQEMDWTLFMLFLLVPLTLR